VRISSFEFTITTIESRKRYYVTVDHSFVDNAADVHWHTPYLTHHYIYTKK
jgi:hypothetical protein